MAKINALGRPAWVRSQSGFSTRTSAIPPDPVIPPNKSIPGRNAHSVAADAVMNQVYVPISAGASTICGAHGGSDANGCIGVFTTPHDDRPEHEQVADRGDHH